MRVVFLGTSLTEGLGLESPATDAWPARVAALADSSGIPMTALNAGIGGETSAGALRRLDWVMGQSPHVLVVETGANDGLRGLPVEGLEANLDEIARRVRDGYPETALVIAQMEAPPNLGEDYTRAFRETFVRVAAARQVPLIPFLLDGVAGVTRLNQSDRIHPTAEGHRLVAGNAWAVLESALREMIEERRP